MKKRSMILIAIVALAAVLVSGCYEVLVRPVGPYGGDHGRHRGWDHDDRD